jgi:hypothetical protein
MTASANVAPARKSFVPTVASSIVLRAERPTAKIAAQPAGPAVNVLALSISNVAPCVTIASASPAKQNVPNVALANVAAICARMPWNTPMELLRSFVLIVPFVAQVANNTVRDLASALLPANASAPIA